MQHWLLYCLNDRGRVVSTERLHPLPKAQLRSLAEARLATCRTVEAWDGAICILRLHAPLPPTASS